MSIKEDIEEIQEKADRIETQSFAMSILEDYKKVNLRLFWIIIILIAYSGFITYKYVSNENGYIETIEEINADAEDGNASGCIGDNCNNG